MVRECYKSVSEVIPLDHAAYVPWLGLTVRGGLEGVVLELFRPCVEVEV
jgi:hypothetical protein